MKPVASTVSALRISAIKEMAIRSAAYPDALSLAWGLPSFRTPEPIRAAVSRELARDPDVGKYSLPDGIPTLRRVIADKHAAETGIELDPDRHIVVTAGNMQGIATMLRVLLDPGDEVIVTDPGFVSHIQQILLCHGKPVFWPLDEGDVWRLQPGRLEALIGPRTRAIILVNPSNPTGALFGREELMETARIAGRHGIRVLLDDPYSGFRYRGLAGFFNPATVAEFRDTVIYLYTFSKAHAMSGWRLGYIVLPDGMKKEVLKVHDANIICAPRVSQAAGIAALANGSPHVAGFTEVLERRRELICERLDRIAHVFGYVRPQGTYYVFPRILATHRDSFEFAVNLLERARVSVTPGSAFGPSGEHHVRMAFCVDEDIINAAFDRLESHFGHG